MDPNFDDVRNSADFDSATYLKMLVAIAKADKDNGPHEYAYVKRQAERLGLDHDHYLQTTDKDYLIEKQNVSRLTALTILKDAIILASLDRNFSLPERQRIYSYAEKLDISRSDVDTLERLVDEFRRLEERWQQLVQLSD